MFTMQVSLTRKKRTVGIVAILLTMTLVITGIIVPYTSGDADVYAAKATKATPYPWSKVSGGTTGDYIADNFTGISKGDHVFRPIDSDRLSDLLTAGGEYYIIFGGAKQKSTQRVLSTINKEAKAKGIKEIYIYNPVYDDYQIDITSDDATVKNWGADIPILVGNDPSTITQLTRQGSFSSRLQAIDGNPVPVSDVHYLSDDGTTIISGSAVTFGSINYPKSPDSRQEYVDWETLTDYYGHFDHSVGHIWKTIQSYFGIAYNDLSVPGTDVNGNTVYGYDVTDTATIRNTTTDPQIRANLEAIRDYESKDTILFRFSKEDGATLPKDTKVETLYKFAQSGVSDFNSTTEANKIDAVFTDDGTAAGSVVRGDTRSDWEYFNRFYTAAVRFWGEQGGRAETGDVKQLFIDYPEAFPASTYGADGEDFNLRATTWGELFDILNSPGEHAIFFGQFGCGNTRAIYEDLARVAKKYDRTVYVVSGNPEGSIHFDNGEDWNRVIGTESGNWWWNYRGTQIGGGHGHEPGPRFSVSYIYGAIFNDYFGGIEKFWSENTTKFGQTVPYYIDGDIGNYDKLTNNPFKYPAANEPDPDAEEPFNAPRVQYPHIVSYNKDADIPVPNEAHWLAVDTANKQTQETKPGVNTEYMLELCDVINFTDNDPTNDLYKTNGGAVDPAERAAEKSWVLRAIDDLDRVIDLSKVTAARKTLATTLTTQPETTQPEQNSLLAFAKTSVPSIAGKAVVGNSLAVNVGEWSNSPAFAYQWYADGKAISGATKASYKLTKASIGKKLTVTVTASKSGYQSVSKTSAATAKVKGVFSKVKKPKITGTAKVGKTLKATVKAVSPKVTAKYQWYANGKAIKGATKAKLKLKKAQKGKKITVKVTYKKTNYVTATAKSKATKKVKK
jgi:hypothetical protein